MSGQRYVPGDSRYSRDSRDRSPPRQHDRYQPGPPSVGGRDAPPRAPKALDAGRGGTSPAPLALRGRGYSGRGDYRSDFRDRESPRDRRPSPPWDRERVWRDRDRDRKSPPRGRPSISDARDFREPLQRDSDRRESTFSAGSAGSDSRSRGFGASRGGFGRGRERDWDDRRRDSLQEDRDFGRPRSRSRDRRDSDRFRDDRSLERRDDERRDERTPDRDDKDRDDRFRQYPGDARRPSAPSTAPTTPHPPYPAGPNRPVNDSDYFAQRRTSSATVPRDPRREVRPDPMATRADASRERYAPGAPSPPPPPQVPAFGSQPWNVWKAPTEPKAAAPADAPTGPKAAPVPKPAPAAPMIDVQRQPPTAPKADRMSEHTKPTDLKTGPVLIKSPPTQPRGLTMLNAPTAPRPQHAKAASPPASPAIYAPTGPRAATAFVSPNSLGINVPTGPKAERTQMTVPIGAPTGPSGGSNWQWQARMATSPPRTSRSIPAKRDLNGEEKQQQPPPPLVTSVEPPAKLASESPVDKAEVENVRKSSPREEDPMDLDEDDFDVNEARFEREKALLESKKKDLSSRYYRGASPLENLALLARITIDDLPTKKTHALNGVTPQPESIPTPKAEGADERTILEKKTPPRLSPPPVSSPELKALPFLNQGPPTPLSELDIFQENKLRHEELRALIKSEMSRITGEELAEEAELREEYAEYYKPWRRHCERLDEEAAREKEREEVLSVEPMPAVQDPSPVVAPPTGEGGRRTRGTFTSEYIVEQVMKESVESALKEQQKRDREALTAKPDPNREAIIPEMLTENEKASRIFKDTSLLRDPDEALEFFQFEPQPDDFTEEEHQTMVQGFKEFPKKWGKLAQSLPGRNYKDLINHYYHTKWDKEYKAPKDKRKGKGGRMPRRQGQGKPKSNALISNLSGARPDLYEGDEFSAPAFQVTDSGRPKRAAAPTFGEKETGDESAHTSTPGKKGLGLKGGEATPESSDKPKRSRGQAKEKGSRRPKQLIRQSSSPEKSAPPPERSLEPPADVTPRELDVLNGLAALQTGPVRTYTTEVFNSATGTPVMSEAKKAPGSQGQRPAGAPSSYWSVQEVSDFPEYLKHYGTDWQSISNQMGSKSTIMVKNYYYRMIQGAKPELEELAVIGDEKRKRGESSGPLPVPTTALAPKRRPEYPTQPPRALAPNESADEDREPPRDRESQREREREPRMPAVPVSSSNYGAISTTQPQRPGHGSPSNAPLELRPHYMQSPRQPERPPPVTSQYGQTWSQFNKPSEPPRAMETRPMDTRPMERITSQDRVHHQGQPRILEPPSSDRYNAFDSAARAPVPRPQQASPMQAESRLAESRHPQPEARVPPPPQPPPPIPRSEVPRKTSNIAAILNADPADEPKRSAPFVPKSPVQTYQAPARPYSQPERRDIMQPERRDIYDPPRQSPSYGPTAPPSRPYMEHQDWQSRAPQSSAEPERSLYPMRNPVSGISNRPSPSSPSINMQPQLSREGSFSRPSMYQPPPQTQHDRVTQPGHYPSRTPHVPTSTPPTRLSSIFSSHEPPHDPYRAREPQPPTYTSEPYRDSAPGRARVDFFGAFGSAPRTDQPPPPTYRPPSRQQHEQPQYGAVRPQQQQHEPHRQQQPPPMFTSGYAPPSHSMASDRERDARERDARERDARERDRDVRMSAHQNSFGRPNSTPAQGPPVPRPPPGQASQAPQGHGNSGYR